MNLSDDNDDGLLGDELSLLTAANEIKPTEKLNSDTHYQKPVISISKISTNQDVSAQKKQHNVNFTINNENKPPMPVVDYLDRIKRDVLGQIVENKMVDKKRASRSYKFGFIRNDKNYLLKLEKRRENLHSFLEQPYGILGLLFRLFRFTIITISIICGSLTTFSSMDAWSTKLLYFCEIFATTYFGIEFLVRVWASGHREQGITKYLHRPMRYLELGVLFFSMSILIFGSIIPFFPFKKSSEGPSCEHFYPSALLLMRFLQILRFLYVDRHAKTWQLVLNTVIKHRFELITSVYIGTILLLFSSYLILIFEKPISDQTGDKHFVTFSDAMYWSIITMTTIGYGDRSPRSHAGKIVATTLCIVGIAFWTLPGGIIGSGFALKVEQKNKKKQFNRLVPAAASFIQAWWRMKATTVLSSSSGSCLIATFKTFDISKPIYSQSLRKLQQTLDKNCVELNNYFKSIDKPSTEIENLNEKKSNQFILLPQSTAYSTLGFDKNQVGTDFEMLLKLSPEHLLSIRLVLTLKFFMAKSKFKHAFKPYDAKDVIERYTQGNMDILLKMEDLQKKIEQITIPNNNFYRNISQDCQSYEEKLSFKLNSNENDSHGHNNQNLRSKSPNSSEKLSMVDRKKRVLSPSHDRKQNVFDFSSKVYSDSKPDQKPDQRNLFDRINIIETNMNSLQKKIDILIEMSTKNATSEFNLKQS